MPSARTEVAVAALVGKIYVVGGFGGGRALEVYDPSADRWQRAAPIPRALHHAAAVSLRGRLYVIGGYANGWKPVDSLFVYDPATDRWSTRAPLPTPRGALAAVVLNGKIHALGGVGPNRRNTPAHEVYDPASDTWTAAAPLPTPRDHLAAGVAANRIYAIGGRVDGSYGRNLAVNEEYDPGTDRWRTRASMPTARSGIAAAVLGESILVFGGEAPSGTFDQAEAYDARTDRWSRYVPMPTARRRSRLCDLRRPDTRRFVFLGERDFHPLAPVSPRSARCTTPFIGFAYRRLFTTGVPPPYDGFLSLHAQRKEPKERAPQTLRPACIFHMRGPLARRLAQKVRPRHGSLCLGRTRGFLPPPLRAWSSLSLLPRLE
jgi:hypothetical protein